MTLFCAKGPHASTLIIINRALAYFCKCRADLCRAHAALKCCSNTSGGNSLERFKWHRRCSANGSHMLHVQSTHNLFKIVFEWFQVSRDWVNAHKAERLSQKRTG